MDVYCPWDVINQCELLRVSRDAPMRLHWENSSNAIVRDILEHATEAVKGEIKALLQQLFSITAY